MWESRTFLVAIMPGSRGTCSFAYVSKIDVSLSVRLVGMLVIPTDENQ